MGFKIGDKVMVVKGSYKYTAIGSEGTVIDSYIDTQNTRVEFYKITGVSTDGRSTLRFTLPNSSLELVPQYKIEKIPLSKYRRIEL